MAVSVVRQNFHRDCEAGINKQINMELHASYVYLAMAYHFDRDDVALPGLHKYFKEQSCEERDHAEKLMKYQNERGGRIVLHTVQKPADDEWSTPQAALEAALQLEKTVNQSLLDLHKVANQHEDTNMCDWLEGNYLSEQVEAIKKISDLLTNLKRAGGGLGEYLFDKETLSEK
ncbi:fts3-like protein [Chamberlinius hualienensis]